MRNNTHEEIERIKQSIIDEFGKNNILNLTVELNYDWHGDYFAFWAVRENGRWIDHARWYNSDGTIKNT